MISTFILVFGWGVAFSGMACCRSAPVTEYHPGLYQLYGNQVMFLPKPRPDALFDERYVKLLFEFRV